MTEDRGALDFGGRGGGGGQEGWMGMWLDPRGPGRVMGLGMLLK